MLNLRDPRSNLYPDIHEINLLHQLQKPFIKQHAQLTKVVKIVFKQAMSAILDFG